MLHSQCDYLCSWALQTVFVEFVMGFIWVVSALDISYLFKYQFFLKEEWEHCRDTFSFVVLPKYKDTEIKFLFVFQLHSRTSYLQE